MNTFGGSGEKLRGLHPEQVHLIEKSLDIFFGNAPYCCFLPCRFLYCLVLDIGKVHPSDNFMSRKFKIACQDILKQERPEIADMGFLVH